MSSARPAGGLASDVATFTASVVVPTPPLAPTKANTAPAAAIARCAQKAVHRGAHVRLCERLGNALVHARAHRFEHQPGVDRRRDQDHV